jgi:hypothetical protein
MIKGCSAIGMKPVCDHRGYCLNDANALFIGQTHNIGYRPHRMNKSYMPAGFGAIASNWDNLCSYTAGTNGNYALCNIPINTHAWRTPAQYNPGFMCAKAAGFSAKLTAKNGAPTRTYDFVISLLSNRGGAYSDRMKEQCTKLDMKPVCDHRGYCQNDKGSVFLGQTHHLAYKPHRNANNYQPGGMAAIRDNWNGLCSYTGKARGNYALCNIPINTHAWRHPGQYNPGFVCAKGQTFSAALTGKNGVKSNSYIFEIGYLTSKKGSYAAGMIKACKALSMKPVCDHRGYCGNDSNSVFLGQTHHLAYSPHRKNNNYSPPGLKAIQHNWDNLCSYTANANGNYALCNIPINTHAWRHPGQVNPGFICGTVYGKKVTCSATQVANSNFAKSGSIKGTGGSKVTVRCNSGYKGGGTVICGANGKFNTVKCTKVAKKCPGDIDGNKKVNIEDLLILLGKYGSTC